MRIMGLATALLVVLCGAGCASTGGGDEVASAGGASSATSSTAPNADGERELALKFAQCMRDNGVPEFPDPKFGDDGGVSLNLPEGVDKAAVDAAEQKCKQYMPNGGEPSKADPQIVAQLRVYSQCMRDNGVPNFPDPTDEGLQVDNDKLGVDPNGEVYQAAQEKCADSMPKGPDGEGPGLSEGK